MVLRNYHRVIEYLIEDKGFTSDKIESLKQEALKPDYARTMEALERYFPDARIENIKETGSSISRVI
jgi:hypothetical protein